MLLRGSRRVADADRRITIPPHLIPSGTRWLHLRKHAGRQICSKRRPRIDMNPDHATARANSKGTNWFGVISDLGSIIFGGVTGGLGGEAATVGEALLGVGGAGTATGSELAHTPSC